jgi:hypothetical protein
MRTVDHRRLIGSAAGLCWLLSGTTHALEPDTIFERVSPSVWTVRALDAQEKPITSGSAVVVGPGRLITNCHVLRQARSIQIRQDNVTYAATLEFPDAERDLCQLAVRNFRAPALTIAPAGTLKVGQRVYAIGSPQGLELTLSDGLISSLRSGEGGAPLIQTSAPISPGSSGGGLFDTEARLIGITSFQRKESQNLNFALPAQWIAEVPERGQAALDKRLEATAMAAVAPVVAPVAPSGEFPKQITGEAFVNFFQINRTLNGFMAGTPVRLDLASSYVDTYTSTPPANTSGGVSAGVPVSVRGRKRQDNSRSELCFGFVGVVHFWRGLEGCYHLVQTSPSEYLLRPVKDATEFRFALK